MKATDTGHCHKATGRVAGPRGTSSNGQDQSHQQLWASLGHGSWHSIQASPVQGWGPAQEPSPLGLRQGRWPIL